MRSITKTTLPCLLVILALAAGCSSHRYVRHLASDACLVTPQKTSKKEILSYFGPPDEKQTLSDGGEEWSYFQQNKSLLRKTPYVGKRLGTEDYDVMVLTFHGDTVATCQYRMFNEKEFKASHLAPAPQPDAQ